MYAEGRTIGIIQVFNLMQGFTSQWRCNQMKKRCTNSACRKTFAADSVCPYCGKEYPRIPSIDHEVYLVNSGRNKVRTIFAIRTLDKSLSLLEMKNMVENCPCVVGKRMTRKDAVLWCKVLCEDGASAKVH